jgi:hypothetical protein
MQATENLGIQDALKQPDLSIESSPPEESCGLLRFNKVDGQPLHHPTPDVRLHLPACPGHTEGR